MLVATLVFGVLSSALKMSPLFAPGWEIGDRSRVLKTRRTYGRSANQSGVLSKHFRGTLNVSQLEPRPERSR